LTPASAVRRPLAAFPMTRVALPSRPATAEPPTRSTFSWCGEDSSSARHASIASRYLPSRMEEPNEEDRVGTDARRRFRSAELREIDEAHVLGCARAPVGQRHRLWPDERGTERFV